MSFAEIEAAIEKLRPDELRRLAVKSWTAFVRKEGGAGSANECDEHDPELLSALDEAVALADASAVEGHSGNQLRARLDEWISR